MTRAEKLPPPSTGSTTTSTRAEVSEYDLPEITLDEAVTAIRKVRAMAHDDDLHARIVDALEQAAFRGEWSYDPELTALEAAIATADIIVAALHG